MADIVSDKIQHELRIECYNLFNAICKIQVPILDIKIEVFYNKYIAPFSSIITAFVGSKDEIPDNANLFLKYDIDYLTMLTDRNYKKYLHVHQLTAVRRQY